MVERRCPAEPCFGRNGDSPIPPTGLAAVSEGEDWSRSGEEDFWKDRGFAEESWGWFELIR